MVAKSKKPIWIRHASQLITMADGGKGPRIGSEMSQLGLIADGSVWIEDGMIQAVGRDADLVPKYGDRMWEARIINAAGHVVTPGFIDPHTHLVFGGSREGEFLQRLKGATYLEIMNAGGGIHATAEATRRATFEELKQVAMGRLDAFLRHGVTTVEAKSGYGLNWETERKQLQVAIQLHQEHPIDIVSTFMGAHAVPKEYASAPDDYIQEIISQMLPAVVEEKLAQFQDVFCEAGVFNQEQTRMLLEAGQKLGLQPKLHADELVPFGGAELAAELGAISADHLLRASEAGLQRMAERKVLAVLLPGTAFFLRAPMANGRQMIDLGVPVALATDFNPGSSPTVNLPLIMNLACQGMGMLPAECMTAVTINAAHAVGRAYEIGSIEVGKKGDLVLFAVSDYLQLFYHYGMNHVAMVMKEGQVVVEDGEVVW
ncbi:imidazolonepropionase [Rubeoparvulum massiliense]|uniref:imidazolonepropionase n=1 Tax=Rubeoparvulum massiliense TaxID=1631346 RepID=UPI00065E150C|nr:imidazolonepropionase [Rubeoparvulum massiliense]